MAVFTYDPKALVVIFAGQIVSGYSDDDLIDVELDDDLWYKRTGVDGEVARALSNNHNGKVTVRLMQSSATNDSFSAAVNVDVATGFGVTPLLARDGSGRTFFAADQAWIKRLPKTGWKKGATFWEWEIDCGRLNVFIGGNNA